MLHTKVRLKLIDRVRDALLQVVIIGIEIHKGRIIPGFIMKVKYASS
jgi:hypothetical protein